MPGKATPLYLVYDGTALDGLLYRIVKSCPPVLDDFRSYQALGLSYNVRDFFRSTGVSMVASQRIAVKLAHRYGLGGAVAVLDLRIEAVVWTKSGGPGHVTVWAPPELLLDHVLQCERHE